VCADEHAQFLAARCLYSVQSARMGSLIHMCNIKLQIKVWYSNCSLPQMSRFVEPSVLRLVKRY